MLKIFFALLAKEKELVFAERAKGRLVWRPSSIIAIVFCIFYLLSPIDIIPEGLLSGITKLYGYIDDIVMLILTGYVVYLDVGGEYSGYSRISNGSIQKKGKPTGQSGVSNKNESISKGGNVTATSTNMQRNGITKQNSSGDSRSTSDGIIFDNSIDNDVGISSEATRDRGSNESSIFETGDNEFIL